MKTKASLFISLVLLAGALLFAACSNPSNSTPSDPNPNPTERAYTSKNAAGDIYHLVVYKTEIAPLAVYTPKAGDTYKLTITYAAGGAVKISTGAVTSVENGLALLNTKGETLTITISSSGAMAKIAGTITFDDETTPTPMSDEDLTSAPQTTANVADGIAKLNAKQFDAAVAAFDAAYAADKNNKDAIIYSTLGRLASIAVNGQVKTLMTDRLGIVGYPGTIDALVSPDWLTTYTDEYIETRVDSWTEAENDDNYILWYDPNPDAHRGGWNFSVQLPPGAPVLAKGYYRRVSSEYPLQLYKGGPATLQTGRLLSYKDTDLNVWLSWQDWDNNGNDRPGYYRQDNWTFVTAEEKIGEQIEYRDAEYRQWHWFETEPNANSYTGYTEPGYYWTEYGTYNFVSADPVVDRSETKLPAIADPAVWMKDSDAYKSGYSEVSGLVSTQNYAMGMMANLIDRNTNGLNAILDGILSAAFGTDFDNAVARAEVLGDSDTVRVSAVTLKALGLSGIFEGDQIDIGKAELKVLFAAMRFTRAGLEWVSAYDWNTDVSFLRSEELWAENDYFEFANVTAPASLPLRNNFLKDRGNGNMDKSRADFIKAIDEGIYAYDTLINRSTLPEGAVDTLNKYKWLRAGFEELKMAINNNGVFYYNEYSEGTGTYSNAESPETVVGVNLGKFFTPGQLALDKIIKNDSGTPTLHRAEMGSMNWSYSDAEWIEVGAKEEILDGDAAAFLFNLGPFEEIIVYTADDDWKQQGFIGFEAPEGRVFWDWYHQ